MTLQALTANRLADGAVVYLTADGRWSPRFADRRPIAGADEGARLLRTDAAAASAEVVEPYLIDIIANRGAGSFRPAGTREIVRAIGPTAAAGRAPAPQQG